MSIFSLLSDLFPFFLKICNEKIVGQVGGLWREFSEATNAQGYGGHYST